MTDATQRLSWKERIIFFGLGLGLALGQAPFGLSFGYFLIIPFFFWTLIQVPNGRMGFGAGWWMGLGYFLLHLNWMVEPFLVEPQVTGWMAPFAIAAVASGFALFYAVPTYLAVRIWFQNKYRVLGFIFLFVSFEYIRAHLLTGFPWGHLSYAFIDLPMVQLAAVLGIHGSLWVWLMILAIPILMMPKIWDGAVWAFVLLLGVNGWGEWRMSGAVARHEDGTIVRLVQPNAPQHLKWKPGHREEFYRRALQYSVAGINPRPDIILWPETAIYYQYTEGHEGIQQIADFAGPSSSVLAGIVRWTESGPRNTAVYIDEAGGVNTLYDKHHLVPFGEYVPLGEYLSAIGLKPIVDTVANFDAGEGARVINGANVPDFLPLICYEAIFPQNVMMGDRRADWLVHITNDAWFGGFSGPFQHLVQTRMRAIEQGLPLARAANTGISAMIDPFGRIEDHIDLGKEGWVDVALPAALPKTIYAYLGEWSLVLFQAFLLAVALFPAGFLRRDP